MGRTLGRFGGTTALVAAALTLVAPTAAAQVGTADVSCSAGNGGGFAAIQLNTRWAQTFTPSTSGKLRYLELKQIARGSGGSGGDIIVDVLTTTGGVPDGPPTAPLATASIPNSAIVADGFFHDYSVTFPAESAAFLEQGTLYAFSARTPDTAQNAWGVGVDTCPGTIFISTGGGFFTFAFTSGEDFSFATYLGPANDDFSRATPLTGSAPVVNGTTAGGSREPSEPDHLDSGQGDAGFWLGDNTVWYSWTAPGSGLATIDVCTAAIDSILAVYTGADLNSLTRVVDDNNSCASGFGSKVTFNATAGTTYRIAVGDAGGARQSTFTLSLTGPSNEPPVITPLKPAPGSKVKSKRPRIKAIVSDSATNLDAGDILSVQIDGDEQTGFSYDSATDTLSHRSSRLGPGRHRVTIDASDGTDTTSKSWSFKVRKRRN